MRHETWIMGHESCYLPYSLEDMNHCEISIHVNKYTNKSYVMQRFWFNLRFKLVEMLVNMSCWRGELVNN